MQPVAAAQQRQPEAAGTEQKARKAVLDDGVKVNEVDLAAFRNAAQPLLDEYHQKPEIEALYRRIRDLA